MGDSPRPVLPCLGEQGASLVGDDRGLGGGTEDVDVVGLEGQLEQVDTPTELYESPANEFVAEFLGTSNILHATVKDGLLNFGFTEVPAECGERGDVAVVARPEHLSPGGGSLQAEITNQFYLGEKIRSFGRLPNGNETIFDADRFSAQPGDEVSLSMDTDRIRIVFIILLRRSRELHCW